MAITLQELLALRGDKQTLAQIDDLVERRGRAQAAIDAATKEIDEIDGKLAGLGIVVGGTLQDDDDDNDRGTPTRRTRAPRAPVGLQRSSEEYLDALDAIGQGFLNEARDKITGPDIVEAMTARGFPSKQGIMKQLKDHPRWSASGIRRSTRYHYHPDDGKKKPARK